MERDLFRVTDSNLAAYFLSNAVELIEAKLEDEDTCVFYFPRDDKTYETLYKFKNDEVIKRYNLGKKKCLEIYRELKSKKM